MRVPNLPLSAEKIVESKLATNTPPVTAGFPRRLGGREPRTASSARPPADQA